MRAPSAQLGTSPLPSLLLLVVGLTSACVEQHEAGADRAPLDAGAGTRGDASALDATGPQSLTFVLENGGMQPVVLGTSCGGAWLRIERAGRTVEIDRSCRCSCRDRDSSEGCHSCPAVCTSTEKQLAPGASERVAWDGVQLVPSPEKGCYEEVAFAVGTELRAEACWNVDAVTGRGTCTSQTFVYGHEREVVLRALPIASAPVAVVLTLENRTGATIELTERCGGLWSWFDVGAPGVTTSTAAFCACTCDEQYGQLACPICGGCADDVVRSVAPGASHSAAWDGTLVYSYPSGCSKRLTAPAGSPLTIDFCWRAANGGAAPEKCAQKTLVHGAGAISLIAE